MDGFGQTLVFGGFAMTSKRFTVAELTSLSVSGLVGLAAIAVVVAHFVVPITLQSVYVGTLTFVGVLAAAIVGMLVLAQLMLIAWMQMHRATHRRTALAAALGSLSLCFACLLATGYLTAWGLNRPEKPHAALWLGFLVTLLAAVLYWRRQEAD
jgi:hypothetical protein